MSEQNKVAEQPEEKTNVYQIEPFKVFKFEDSEDVYHNQFIMTGTLLDIWADVLPGKADQKNKFYSTIVDSINNRMPEDASFTLGKLFSTGWAPQSRGVMWYKRADIRVAIYLATYGKDFYISWRAFYWAISFAKIALIAVLSVVGLLIVQPSPVFFDATTMPLLNFVGLIPLWGTLLWGVFFRDGDFLAFFRKRPSEFVYDDLMAATSLVHRAVIEAADSIGVEEAKLAVAEPVIKQRKPRI